MECLSLVLVLTNCNIWEPIKSNFLLLFSPFSAQYEPGVLEACLDLLKVSPQHQTNRKKDYMNRSNPVYISRIVSAMVSVNRLQKQHAKKYKLGTNPIQTVSLPTARFYYLSCG